MSHRWLLGAAMSTLAKWKKPLTGMNLVTRSEGLVLPYLGVMTKSPKRRSNPRFIKLLRDVKLDYWADKYSQSGK